MNRKTIPNKDAAIKTAMEILFPDLLRFIFKDADEIFDFSEPVVFLDKELDKIEQTPKKGGGRVLDKLARVKVKSGGYEHVLVLLEAEGGGKKDFAERMFIHYYRVRDKHGGKICSIALLTDRNKKFHPTGFKEECLGTRLNFDFNTIKIWGQNKEELEKNDNLFSVAALTMLAELERGYLAPGQLIELGKAIAVNLQQRNVPGPQRKALLAFLHAYINFDNPEIEAKFEHEINLITNKTKVMAIMGIREMVEKEYRKKLTSAIEKTAKEAAKSTNLKTAENLLKQGVSIPTISKGTGLPLAEVRKLAKQIPAKAEGF